MVVYGIDRPTAKHGFLSRANNGQAEYNLVLPLYHSETNILTLAQRGRNLDTAKIKIVPRGLNERFTALQQLRDGLTDDWMAANTSFIGEDRRFFTWQDGNLQLLDNFVITQKVRDFVNDWNALRAGWKFPKAIRKLTDVQFSVDGDKLAIILVGEESAGMLNTKWDTGWVGSGASNKQKTAFYKQNMGPKSIRGRIQELFMAVHEYFDKIKGFDEWSQDRDPTRPDLENAFASLYLVGNFGRAALDPTTRSFGEFLELYDNVLKTIRDLDIQQLRPKLIKLIEYLDKDSIEAVGNAELGGDTFANQLSNARDRFESQTANVALRSQLISKEQIQTAYESDKSATTLGNLSLRLSERLEEIHKRRGSLRDVPGGELAKLIESVEYLQEEANKIRDFGDVLKNVVNKIPSDDWRYFQRTIFPKDFAKEITATARNVATNTRESRISIKRPHNIRSWQRTGFGDRLSITEGSEVVYGRYKQDGATVNTRNEDKNFSKNIVFPKRYGSRTIDIHFANDDDGDDIILSTQVTVDLGLAIPENDFKTLDATPEAGGLKVKLEVELSDVYTAGSYQGFVEEIIAYVHEHGSAPTTGKQVSFPSSAGKHEKIVTLDDATTTYSFSARMKTKGGLTDFIANNVMGFNVVATPAVVLPTTTRQERTQNIGTADEHRKMADESEASRATSSAMVDAKTLDLEGHNQNIDKFLRDIQQIVDDPDNHHLDAGMPSTTTPLKAAAKTQIQRIEAQIDAEKIAARSAEKGLQVESSRSLEATVARESATQNIEAAKSREVLEDIREAVSKPDPVTLGDFYKLLQRRSYNLPLNTGSAATEEFNKLSVADQTWAVSHRDKLRVFLEKRSLDRDETVTGPEFIRVLQEAISSHMPSAIKQDQESFRATSRSILQARTKGIGKPFMKKNKRLRLRLA